MTGWIIFLCILVIILFILFMPIVVDFKYEDNKTYIKASYCGFTVFDSTKKKPPITPEEKKTLCEKKRLKKQQKEEKAARKMAKQEAKNKKRAAKGKPVMIQKKRTIKDYIALVKSLLEPVGKGARRLFKGIRISRLYIDIKVGNFDAYECALQYGRICTAVSNLLAFFQSFFNIKADHIEVLPRFGCEATVYTAKFRAKASPSAVLAAIAALVWTYFKKMLRSQQDNVAQNTYSKTRHKEDTKNADSK